MTLCCFSSATNWFNAPYTGPTTTAGASQYATYLEDSSTNKAITYLTAYQNFIAGASLGLPISPTLNITQGGFGGVFLGCYSFQFGWIWQATATWVREFARWRNEAPHRHCILTHAPFSCCCR